MLTQHEADVIAAPYREALRLAGFEPVEGFPQRFQLPNTPLVATVDIMDNPVISYNY